jgi:uncharacterized membrane protein YdbT with pleckstrin-like domain
MRTSLNEKEKVLLVVHQHWLVLAGPALIALVGIATSIIWFRILKWIGLGVALLLILHFVWRVFERKYNLWAITDQRIIDEFGVLTANSKESPLDKINNVSYHQSLWGRIFGYGDVSIQTAAEMGATVYDNLAHPKLVKATISTARGKFSKSFFREEGEAFADAVNEKENAGGDFAKEMTALYQLKMQGIITEEEYNAKKQKLMDISGGK